MLGPPGVPLVSILRRYPGLADLASYIEAELGYRLPIERVLEDEDIVSRAREILEAAVRSGELPPSRDPWVDVVGFHAALAAAGLSRSLRLQARLATIASQAAAEALRGEKLSVLFTIARRLGVQVEEARFEIPWLYSRSKGVLPRLMIARVRLPQYLRLSSSLEGAKWRLSNSMVLDGYVYLDRSRLEGLVAQAYKARLERLMRAYADSIESRRLEDLGSRMASELDRERPPAGSFDPSAFPECIRRIEARIAGGEFTREEFYTLVTFLAGVGAPPSYLADVIYASGAASRPVASIMAEALIAEARGYRPLKCEVLRRLGVCECEKDLLAEYFSRVRAGSRRR